jgi:hypothetical protein
MSNLLTHYQVWCDTEGAYVDWWIPSSNPKPTTCPHDSNHTLDQTKTQIADSETAREVITLFEKNDKTVKIASAKITVDGTSGVGTGKLTAPGSFTAGDGRWLDCGTCWFDNPHPDDRIMEVNIIDENGNFGVPPGTIVRTYYDDELEADQQGWRIPIKWGQMELEPFAGYGFLPAECSIQIVVQKGGTAPFTGTFYVNVSWGKTDLS